MDVPHNVPDVYLFESALAELLAEGVAKDMRPTLQNFITAPESIQQAYERLPPQEQAQLDRLLPAFDVTCGDRLRNPSLSEALSEFQASMDEAPTPPKLQRRRDRAWTPAVGDPCEGRYKAGEDGAWLRKDWFPGKIVEIVVGHAAPFRVRYDDGDEEDAVARRFVRPPLLCGGLCGGRLRRWCSEP